jgi:hypothetical protein
MSGFLASPLKVVCSGLVCFWYGLPLLELGTTLVRAADLVSAAPVGAMDDFREGDQDGLRRAV